MAGRLGRMGAWTVELPGFKQVWSDEVYAIYEMPPGAALSVDDAINRYAPEFRETITGAFEACVRDGTPYDVELQIITAKGRRVWVRAIGEAERDANGVIRRVQGALQDIAALKQAETVLRESEEKFQQLAESVADVFWVNSPEMQRMHYVSPAYEKIWGRSVESLYAHPTQWNEAILPEDFERVSKTFGRLAAEETSVSAEFRIARPDGAVRWIHSRGFQFRDGAGKVIRITGIASDITERKRAEAELEKIHGELVNASRRAGMAEVATGILHNVGNALNSVNIASSCVAENIRKSKSASLSKVVTLLRDYETEWGPFLTHHPKGKQIPAYLALLASHLAGEEAAALTELAQLQKSIEHIKDIVAMQQGLAKVSGITERLCVTNLVEDALKMNSSALAGHDIVVVREFQNTPLVMAEKHQVLQILVNLVSNAQQACDDSHRPEKRLTIRVTNGNGCIRIAVTDNGIGIQSDNLTRIFAHGFTTKKSGHGFGLHSAALAAKEMGGSLSVHSDGAGCGATFTLELPAEPPAPFPINGSRSAPA
jgi:PAS domain S-box-containing protein